MTYLALAENTILNTEGHYITFDYMVDAIDCQESILRFSKGGFGSSYLRDIQAELSCEEQPLTQITLSTGEVFTILDDSQLLSSDNTWIQVSDVKAGDGLKTLSYNPLIKHPQLTPKVIIKVEHSVSPFIPVVSFETRSDNLLLAVNNGSGVSMLVPLKPKAVAYSGILC